jgi:Flp pilus assembly protein TadG
VSHRGRRLRRRDEAGYAAVLVALLASVIFLGMGALGVDTARWYVEVEQVQKTADAAALAGVTHMPNDLPAARTAALASAKKNGYDDALDDVKVSADVGGKPSELKVTVSSRVKNTFGAGLGVGSAWITRSAVADYTAPAPMGSPCNTFGNEPPSQPVPAAQPAGSALPTGSAPNGDPLPFKNCSSSPAFWAAIEGPKTDKVQGDRFMTTPCASTSTYACASSKNSETRPEGYFWSVHVEPEAVNTAITVQVYDPAFMYTGISCDQLYDPTNLLSYMSDYTQNDGLTRYAKVTASNTAPRTYCSGDYNPGGSAAASDSPVTSFAVRHANDTDNPKTASVIDPAQCTKQFVGVKAPPTISQLRQWTDAARTTKNTSHNLQMSRLFHQWVDLCTFTPDVPGDYYVQVRTNVATTGGTAVANTNASNVTSTSLIYTGNPNVTSSTATPLTSGTGLNSFALRAIPSDTSKTQYIAVAGHESMPILQNAPGQTAKFNLIRALPGTRGQYIAFDFFDGGDGATSGDATVQIFPPDDSSGSIKSGPGGTPPGCQHAKNNEAYAAADSGCKVRFRNSTHNGQVEHVVIPIPAEDYNCKPETLGGCWFSVQITFPVGDTVTDFTTWTANIGGDPVRLVE